MQINKDIVNYIQSQYASSPFSSNGALFSLGLSAATFSNRAQFPNVIGMLLSLVQINFI